MIFVSTWLQKKNELISTTLISNPAIIVIAVLVVAGLTVLWFVGGPLLFWKVLRDARLWLAVAAACAIFGYAHLSKDLAATQKKLDTQQSQCRPEKQVSSHPRLRS